MLYLGIMCILICLGMAWQWFASEWYFGAGLAMVLATGMTCYLLGFWSLSEECDVMGKFKLGGTVYACHIEQKEQKATQ